MPLRGRVELLLLTVAVLCGQASAGYKAGYFRYGALSWRQTGIEADGITVKFTLKTAWSSAMFSRSIIVDQVTKPTSSRCMQTDYSCPTLQGRK
jgi:hypothetical protein